MSADQGSSKVLTLEKSASASHVLDHVVPSPEAAAKAVPALPALPAPASAAIDTRTLSRSLFLRHAALEENSPERAYVRDTLI